jgi:hypothetical protein
MSSGRYGGTGRNILVSMYYWILTAIGALAGNSVLVRLRAQAAVDRGGDGGGRASINLTKN